MKWRKGEIFRVTGLYLLIIPFLNALNATGYENPQIQGYFGASGTEFLYMNLIPLFVLVAGIPLALELSKQFPLRSLLLFITVLSFLLNTLSAYAPGIGWFTVCRSLLSFLTIFGIVATLIPIVMQYNPALNMAIMYGIVQFIIQGSSHLYKFLGAHFAHIYDWRTSILMVNINFLACIVLAWIFIRKDITPFKKPFSFDFRGWGIFILFLLPLLFLSAEGQTREWFSDQGVKTAVLSVAVIAVLYVFYARSAKQPLIDLKVFTYRNVVVGTLLYFLTGAMNGTGSIVMGFMAGLLGFDDLYMARTHLFVFIGIAISVPLCTYMLYYRIHLRFTAIAGFIAFTLFHILMAFRFYPGIAQRDFFWPLLLKGIGIGFLYVLSSLYISERIPKQLSTSRMLSGIMARVVFALMLGGAVFATRLSKQTVMHQTGISQQLTAGNKAAADTYRNTRDYYLSKGLDNSEAEKMADDPLRYEMNKSAAMLAYKEIYLVMAGVSFLPVLLILLFRMGRRSVQRIEVEPIPV
jgi:DHA2 family multidrug resistance protein